MNLCLFLYPQLPPPWSVLFLWVRYLLLSSPLCIPSIFQAVFFKEEQHSVSEPNNVKELYDLFQHCVLIKLNSLVPVRLSCTQKHWDEDPIKNYIKSCITFLWIFFKIKSSFNSLGTTVAFFLDSACGFLLKRCSDRHRLENNILYGSPILLQKHMGAIPFLLWRVIILVGNHVDLQ